MLTRGSFEVARNAPIVDAILGAATNVLGAQPEVIGEPYWMDAALLSDVGIDTVVIGPSGAGAHALEEWVDLDSIASLTDILTTVAAEFCRYANGRGSYLFPNGFAGTLFRYSNIA